MANFSDDWIGSLRRFCILLAELAAASIISPAHADDFSTPEGAIRTLEAAYIAEDIEAAVAARDFREEARLELVKLSVGEDEELVAKMAEVLERAFRLEIKSNGFPKFGDLKCSLGAPVRVTAKMVKLTETCIFPDGGSSVADLHVADGERGWRLVNVPSP